ncbi:hypothetical protein SMRU11_32990 [Sinorhizobium meliloti RU11/001]|nr:hypothetical protein SMRU11_32990 [Sinorhizobium meliloti RU11/001]
MTRLEPPHCFSCTAYASRNSGLRRRASYQTRKGRCSALICCMFLTFDRLRSKETCTTAPRVLSDAQRSL